MKLYGAHMQMRDPSKLTAAELKTYELYKKGLTNREIAKERGVKYGTVVSTLKIALDKIGTNTKAQNNASSAVD